jgi:hypothetical protein
MPETLIEEKPSVSRQTVASKAWGKIPDAFFLSVSPCHSILVGDAILGTTWQRREATNMRVLGKKRETIERRSLKHATLKSCVGSPEFTLELSKHGLGLKKR